MATLINSVKLFSVLFPVLFIFACGGGGGDGGSSSIPPNFSSSDFSGTWNFLAISTGGYNEGIAIGTVIMNSSGAITGGSYMTSGGTNASFTGGSISISGDQGIIHGSASSNVGVTIALYQGKLNSGKTFASFVDYTNFGEFDLVNLIKTQESFAQSDLAGDWTILGLSAGGTIEDSFHGVIQINSDGNVTGASSYLRGESVTYNSGALTINTSGITTGNLSTITGVTINCLGAMDTSKSMGSFGSTTSVGEHSLTLALKNGGNFVLGDLDGTWYFSLAASGGVSEGVSYGSIIISSGQVRGGTLRVGNTDVQLSGGSISITTEGILSGTVDAADGESITISSGKMNTTKTALAIVGTSNTGNHDFIIAHKGS